MQIGDFGIAAQSDSFASIVEDVGTLAYQAPEMFDGSQYDSKADIWSIGCIIFSICNFDYPFYAPNEKKMIEKVRTMRHRQLDQKYPKEFKEIYEICRNKNYMTRPSATDLLGLEIV